jgi:hypothetical protein
MPLELSPNYLQDSNDDPNFVSPVGPPMGESVLLESIYYNSHIIPKNAEFKVE